MLQLNFPERFIHRHPPVRNVNEIIEEHRPSRNAPLTESPLFVGSWRFILVQSILLVCWAALNVTAWIGHRDPYPFRWVSAQVAPTDCAFVFGLVSG
jgi:uncharacterized membrane protein